MYYTKTDRGANIRAASYELEVRADAISVILAGEQVALLRPASAVNKVCAEGKKDIPGSLTFAEAKEKGAYIYTWSGKSSEWDEVVYTLRVMESHAEYFITVRGKGDVDSVDYFIGNPEDNCRGSEYEFDTGYMPIPTVDGAAQCEFSAQRECNEFSYLTVPPLFVYTFDIMQIEPKLAMGLVADPGNHNFTKFDYRNHSGNFLKRFWFTTDQDGHTHVDGEWKTPSIIIYGALDRMDSLKFYSDYYFATKKADAKDQTEKKPRFWYGPMACGWIEQASYEMKHGIGRGGADMAYQPLYDAFNAELERRDLHPTIMIIDDKWQTTYGGAEINPEKWPDLRGWIDDTLAKYNRYTMLWYKLWDAEGLPEEMTMPDGKGGRVADPTNPKYREYLRETMHRLLSSDEGCANAWGLKLDYAFIQPVGKDAVSYDGKYGVELYLEYIKLIYKYAKEAKPEACISGSPCHPLFAAYVDHARLHDYYPDLRRVYEEFKFRRDIWATALPGALIDTDGAAFHSHRDTMRHMRLAAKLGIPDLYCITDMPSITLTDEDWEQVANLWREYSERIDSMVK